jgi:isoquinoline 1-oxidoreductase beta subunit
MEHEAAAGQPGLVARNDGDTAAALAAGGKTLEAVYDVPYLEHACMEAMNATVHVTADACTVWVPTQNPGGSREVAARLTGLPVERVTVNTTLLGGGFGRRGQTDYVVDAVETAKAIGGGPVKVMWTREDDLTHGFYRPSTYNVFRAALDGQGKPAAWFTRVVGAGLLRQRGAPAGQVDNTSMAALRDLPYDIPNVRIEWVDKDVGVPIGFWRSVGSSQNGFIVECFVDELAHLAGQDPYEYRRALLGKSPRHKAVLELAATKAGWGSPLPARQGRGIAVCFSYGSYAAHVVEVSVADEGAVRITKVVSAIDCGIAVNPDQVKAQMEGGFIYALTATLYGKITVDKGRVEQTNFHTYPMLRIAEAPVVETHILDSGQPPGGLGEPGVPTVAPAICNAIFAATGKRIRRLPIDRELLKRA